MKKTLNKSSNSNQLGTFFDLYASCSCGLCTCSCSGANDVTTAANILNIEAGYRNALAIHS